MFYKLENGNETQLTDKQMIDILAEYYRYKINGTYFAANAVDDMMLLGTPRTINGAVYQWRPK